MFGGDNTLNSGRSREGLAWNMPVLRGARDADAGEQGE
jgi:hypothetical protein